MTYGLLQLSLWHDSSIALTHWFQALLWFSPVPAGYFIWQDEWFHMQDGFKCDLVTNTLYLIHKNYSQNFSITNAWKSYLGSLRICTIRQLLWHPGSKPCSGSHLCQPGTPDDKMNGCTHKMGSIMIYSLTPYTSSIKIIPKMFLILMHENHASEACCGTVYFEV